MDIIKMLNFWDFLGIKWFILCAFLLQGFDPWSEN